MLVGGVPYRSLWVRPEARSVCIIDQTRLPHVFVTAEVTSLEAMAEAIRSMQVRGAPLIGIAAAYGIALAMRTDPSDLALQHAEELLVSTRPTAINLRWAVGRLRRALDPLHPHDRADVAFRLAGDLADADVSSCRAIGVHGQALLAELWQNKKKPPTLHVLTHCNAGWLATVDFGTALAPVYLAHDAGIPVHVWVDETRPRNQGASLTVWELAQHGVPHTLITDNVGGHLMQHQNVDVCLVGADRISATGDVCNKIGTYLKALAAHDNGVPFYVAAPCCTVDGSVGDGIKEIPIEEREGSEVLWVNGVDAENRPARLRIASAGTPIANYAFDVTPARLVTGIITERGIVRAERSSLGALVETP